SGPAGCDGSRCGESGNGPYPNDSLTRKTNQRLGLSCKTSSQCLTPGRPPVDTAPDLKDTICDSYGVSYETQPPATERAGRHPGPHDPLLHPARPAPGARGRKARGLVYAGTSRRPPAYPAVAGDRA